MLILSDSKFLSVVALPVEGCGPHAHGKDHDGKGLLLPAGGGGPRARGRPRFSVQRGWTLESLPML